MSWIDTMPDEVFKTFQIAGAGLALVAGTLLVSLRGDASSGLRRVAHVLLCTGGLSLGVGVAIAGARYSEDLSHTALVVVVVGVATTTVVYVAFIITSAKRLLAATVALALFTAMASIAMGASINTEECVTITTDSTGGDTYVPC